MYWEQSDKKEWFYTCSKCSKSEYLVWPDNIDIEQGAYVCSMCKQVLRDEDRINGAWNKTSEGEFSGYHISQLMLYNKSAKDIIDAYNDPTKDKQFFYNFVLGLPYLDSSDRIDPSIVLRNCVDTVNPQEGRTIIGVDTGDDYISYVLMNKDGIFFYDTEKGISATKTPYDKLRELLKRFPKSIVVIDQGGELMNTRQLQQEFPGRIFLVYYNKDRKTVGMADWGEGEEYWKVRADRNRLITLAVEQMRDIGRFRLNGTKEEWNDYAAQWGNIYREKLEVKETKGKDDRSLYGNEYVWKRNGPDHYVHATVYALIGLMRYSGEQARVLGENVWAGTPSGHVIDDSKLMLGEPINL